MLWLVSSRCFGLLLHSLLHVVLHAVLRHGELQPVLLRQRLVRGLPTRTRPPAAVGIVSLVSRLRLWLRL